MILITFYNLSIGTRLANTSAHSIASLDEGPSPLARLALVHIAVLLFILFLLLASTCLGAQYVHKYRKYQLAAAAEEMDSITEYSSKCRPSLKSIHVHYLLVTLNIRIWQLYEAKKNETAILVYI